MGVDALIIGSLTEFGRKTVGESGFLSSTKRQVAHAKVEFRLVDVKTGQVFHTASGSGEASIEKGSIAGFGSTASYDATLNDKAIKQAISESVNNFSQTLLARKWHTYFLSREGAQYFISGGPSQGIRPGMTFAVETEGKVIKSKQTGFPVQLPGKKVATLEVQSTFGDAPANEGAVATLVSGSLNGYAWINWLSWRTTDENSECNSAGGSGKCLSDAQRTGGDQRQFGGFVFPGDGRQNRGV